MTKKEKILELFASSADGLPGKTPIIPDLLIWHSWHSKQGTLPEELKGLNLEDTCRHLGVPIWNSCRPWNIESSEVEVTHIRERDKRIIRYQHGKKTLNAVWIKGPDGDWWQTEYPVKTVDDLEVIRAYVEGRTFNLQPGEYISMIDRTGDDGLVAPQLPPRAFSWLMLEILGWSEGLMVLMDGEEKIRDLVILAESQVQAFTRTMTAELEKHGGSVYLSPDNLDGMFISPPYFEQYLANGYETISGILHEKGSYLMVHCGGPLGRILELAGQTGIDCMAGVCGPPQGDTPLEDARTKLGDGTIIWGGIPQDWLIDITSWEDFEKNTRKIVEDFARDHPSILGIADHVSIDTDFSRLKQTIRIAQEAGA